MKQLGKAVDYLRGKKEVGFDTETTGLLARGRNSDFKVVSIILSSDEKSFYIPINHVTYDKNIDKDIVSFMLQPLFSDTNVTLIGQDFKFDNHVLNRIDIEVQRENFFDTLIAARLVDENMNNSLENLIETYLGIEGLTKYDEVVATVPNEIKKGMGLKGNEKPTFDLVDIKNGSEYGVEDTCYLPELKAFLIDKMKEEGLYDMYVNTMLPFNTVLYNMERRGVRINKNRLDTMSVEMQKDMSKLEDKLHRIAGIEINYNSSIQVAELLYGWYNSDSPCDKCKDECDTVCEDYEVWSKYGHKNPNIDIREKSFEFPVPEKTETGNPSSGKVALERFKHYTPKNERQEEGLELINLYLEYKKISKLYSTFVKGLREKLYDDGRVHPSFSQIATSTGRLSSSQPNAQNLSNSKEDDKYKIRDMFIPDEGYTMMAVDYDNLEVKILTNFSEDPNLIEMFEKGYDAHGTTAVRLLGLDCHPNEAKEKYPVERAVGKTLNFAQLH